MAQGMSQIKKVEQDSSFLFTESSLREKIIEHLFLGELLRCLWRRGLHDVEVLWPEVDRAGYDLVIEANSIIRHIQLKTSHRSAKRGKFDVHANLATKPSACVILIRFDKTSLELGPYQYFGSPARMPLPELGDRRARHTKADKLGNKLLRRQHFLVGRARFKTLDTIDELAEFLFWSTARR
jgi:hypothetical protein